MERTPAQERYLYYTGFFADRRLAPAACERVLAFLEVSGGAAARVPVAVTAGQWESVTLHHDGRVFNRAQERADLPLPYFERFTPDTPEGYWRSRLDAAMTAIAPAHYAVEVEWGDYPSHFWYEEPGRFLERYIRLWGSSLDLRQVSVWYIDVHWRSDFTRLGPEFLRWHSRAEHAIGGTFKRSRWRWWEPQEDGTVKRRLIRRSEWLAAMTAPTSHLRD
jgi:hypothetical protein